MTLLFPDRALRATSALSLPTDDSRQVRPGTLFVCKGRAFKREYLLSAIADGAVAYVSEVDYDVDLPAVIVSDIRRTLAVVADAFYGHPSGKVKVCAFTGTKGKSTCSFYLRGILANEAKLTGCHRPALNTGIEFDDGIETGPSKRRPRILPAAVSHRACCGGGCPVAGYGGIESGPQIRAYGQD